ncbi:MAG: hypothetical protein ABSF25_15825 [Bryobacteraceae bacterium]|jgi:hypothetical protein
MMRHWLGPAMAAALLLPAARAQFDLTVVNSSGEQPAPPVYNMGAVYPGETVAAAFRIRNTSAAAATLDLLQVAGVGFQLASGPQLPAALPSQAAVDFSVTFQASMIASYSAALRSDGISIFLTAQVLPWLTYSVDSGTGLQPLAGAVDFGVVVRGSDATRHFTIVNQMSGALAVPLIVVQGEGFAFAGASPSGIVLQPGQGTAFDLQFQPGAQDAAGLLSGSLAIGNLSFGLTGTVADPPLPQPKLAIALAQAASAQQGSVSVQFDAPAKIGGSGTLTLGFQPAVSGATDPAVAFASGGRLISFTVAVGDAQVNFAGGLTAPFQTGTTAGALVFTVQLGGSTDQQTVVISPAVVGVTVAQAVRQTGSIEVQVVGFDNTRSAAALTFTFFDAAGNALAPGAIQTDASAAFANYFRSSAAGGAFLLTAVFPVTGDASQVFAFETQIANSAGTAVSARTGI